MRISSRPTHRKIRKSTLAIRREKWQREARAVMSRSFARMISDGDLAIPRRALEVEFAEPRELAGRDLKPSPPICQPAPGTRFGGGDDGAVWTVMLIVLTFAAALILWCMLLVD